MIWPGPYSQEYVVRSIMHPVLAYPIVVYTGETDEDAVYRYNTVILGFWPDLSATETTITGAPAVVAVDPPAQPSPTAPVPPGYPVPPQLEPPLEIIFEPPEPPAVPPSGGDGGPSFPPPAPPGNNDDDGRPVFVPGGVTVSGLGGVDPVYLVGGALALWWLLRG